MYIAFTHILILLISIILINCSDKTSPDIPEMSNHFNFTVHYTDSSSKDYEMEYFLDSNCGAFYNSDTATTCIMYSYPINSIPYLAIMSFAGSDTGSYKWQGINSSTDISISMSREYGDTYYGLEGQTIIRKYGKIGNTVEGSFNGIFYRMKIPAIDTVLITGNFVLIRNEDKIYN